MPLEFVYESWCDWFWQRWLRGEGTWCGGEAIYNVVMFGEYDGFGGEW